MAKLNNGFFGLLVGLAVSTMVFSSHDSFAAKLVDENICILENMGNTRSQVARASISQACNFLSLHEASLVLNKEERAYHECVLKYLPGVEVDFNAADLARSCRQLVWDRRGRLGAR